MGHFLHVVPDLWGICGGSVEDLVGDLVGDLNKVTTNHGFDSHPKQRSRVET